MHPSRTLARGRAEAFPLGASVTLEQLDVDPHPVLALLREREPVSWVGALEAWYVTRRDLALRVVRDPASFTVDDPRFSTAQVIGRSMLSVDGDEHARHRGPFARPFRLDAVRERFETLVEESLRLEPAAAVVDRFATRDIELAGAPIRRGELVTVSIAGANRDPVTFVDPDRFDIRRPNAQLQLAFAQGPHVCLGMHLARVETVTTLRRAFGRLHGLRLDPGRPSVVRGRVFRKPRDLHVLWG